jgi:hypothetical protein
MICGFVTYFLMIKHGLSNGTAKIIAVFGVGLVIQILPKRTRHIPARVKRQAVTDYGTGDLHPRTPYAEGASNSADNIEVQGRKGNRSKGAKAGGA